MPMVAIIKMRITNGIGPRDMIGSWKVSKAMYCRGKGLNIQVIEPFQMIMLWGERGNAQMD